MIKMGYVIGEGLGKDGRGRAEPVPIQLLPQGIQWKLLHDTFLNNFLKTLYRSSNAASKTKPYKHNNGQVKQHSNTCIL